MRALLGHGQRVKQAPQGEEVCCVLQGTWRFFLAPCTMRDMNDQAPKSLRQRIVDLMLECRRAENTLRTRIYITPALEAGYETH